VTVALRLRGKRKLPPELVVPLSLGAQLDGTLAREAPPVIDELADENVIMHPPSVGLDLTSFIDRFLISSIHPAKASATELIFSRRRTLRL
jgi:hypothetical protein